MTKHTPGPWRTGGKDGRIIYAADGFAVADATVFHGRHEGEHSENARLIAAAPAMLEALQKLVDHVLHYATFEYSAEDAHKDAADARAAIALATGATE